MTRIANRDLPFLPIEPGTIPIPPVVIHKSIRKPHARWGLDRLEVGQSVFMKGAKAHPKKLFFALKRERGILFSARVYKNSDGMPVGVRVWRVM
jgi:hypothetical protein